MLSKICSSGSNNFLSNFGGFIHVYYKFIVELKMNPCNEVVGQKLIQN